MSIEAIIALIIAAVVGVAGMFAGNKLGKSTGRKEGAAQAVQEQQVTQSQVTVQAVKERNDVEVKVAATPRAGIDRELSEFSRPD